MKYPDDYLFSKDIDWFCIINGIYVHVASARGTLPAIVNDREKLRKNQRLVYEMADIFTDDQIEVNQSFLLARFGDQGDGIKHSEYYLDSFLHMARKGFVSLDRTNLADPYNNTYHVVCMPESHIQIAGLNELCNFTSRTTGLLKHVSQDIALLDEITDITD